MHVPVSRPIWQTCSLQGPILAKGLLGVLAVLAMTIVTVFLRLRWKGTVVGWQLHLANLQSLHEGGIVSVTQ